MPELKQKSQYEECVMEKQARNAFPSGVSRRSNSCLQLVHMDLCGPMSEESLGGNMYFYFFVDDCTRWCWVFFVKNKSEAFGRFKSFHALVERQTGMKLKVVRSDRGENSFQMSSKVTVISWGSKENSQPLTHLSKIG